MLAQLKPGYHDFYLGVPHAECSAVTRRRQRWRPVTLLRMTRSTGQADWGSEEFSLRTMRKFASLEGVLLPPKESRRGTTPYHDDVDALTPWVPLVLVLAMC